MSDNTLIAMVVVAILVAFSLGVIAVPLDDCPQHSTPTQENPK